MRWLWVSAVLTLLADQASKWAVVWWLGLNDKGVIPVVPPFLVFRMGWNDGINFGIGGGSLSRWLLVVLAVAICAFAVRWVGRDPRALAAVSGGLLIGGALGNVIDRLRFGAVADFLNMSCCGISNPYTFNIADVGVFLGAVGLILFPPRRAERRNTP